MVVGKTFEMTKFGREIFWSIEMFSGKNSGCRKIVRNNKGFEILSVKKFLLSNFCRGKIRGVRNIQENAQNHKSVEKKSELPKFVGKEFGKYILT